QKESDKTRVSVLAGIFPPHVCYEARWGKLYTVRKRRAGRAGQFLGTARIFAPSAHATQSPPTARRSAPSRLTSITTFLAASMRLTAEPVAMASTLPSAA